MSEPEGGGIFVSYRRQESSFAAGRLADQLINHFGTDRVFIDVDTIEPGIDFTEAIARAVETCEVLLAVIGPQWLTAVDEQGHRRLDDPDDIVRTEIEAALARNVRVIPILMENTVMPRRQDLPESLASLARRNAFTVRHESFRYDAERLLTSIESIIVRAGSREQPEQVPEPEQTAAQQVPEPEQTAAQQVPEPEQTAAQPKKTAHSGPRRKRSATKPRTWQLELVQKEGQTTIFRLSSGSETYEIAVRFPIVASATIKVDGERVSKGWEIAGRTYHLSSLSSKLGSDVTIQVNMTSERAVRSLILKIGDQVLKYPDK